MKTILVVDADERFAHALLVTFRAHHWRVLVAHTGRDALVLAGSRPPDAVLLDLDLPDMEGRDLIQGLRAWTTVPIIVASRRGAELDKIEALDHGADDYMTKPLAMGELLARLRATQRRSRMNDLERVIVETEDFVIDLPARRATNRSGDIRLTPKEWGIFEVLVRNPGRLVTQMMLLREVWGPEYESETHYLRVYMTQIRRKLEPHPATPRYFLTEPGIGLRFEPGVVEPRRVSPELLPEVDRPASVERYAYVS